MVFESPKFNNERTEYIKISGKKESKKDFIDSVRKRFKQALHTGVFTAMTWISMSESLGPDAKELLTDLKFQDKISSYKEKADRITAMREVLIREKILNEAYVDMLEKISSNIDILQKELGKDLVDGMIDAYDEEQFEEREEPPSIVYDAKTEENFGSAFQILPDVIKSFPKKWSANIKEIEFSVEEGKVPVEYSLPKEIKSVAQVEGRGTEKKGVLLFYVSLLKRVVPSVMVEGARRADKLSEEQKILFFKLDKLWSIDDIEDTVSHEIAHCNDWTAHYLSVPERIDLALAVLARIKSDNRYHSWYVESIRNDNAQIELSFKMVEYWAEIVSRYYKNKGQLPEADRQLVERYLALAEKKSQ